VQSAVLRLHVVSLSVCLSVRPSVTLVDCDHIGWNSPNIIPLLVSQGRSLSADPNMRGYSRGHPEIWAQIDPPPVDLASETFDCKLRPNGYRQQRSQWRTYRKPPSLFQMVPSLTPYDLPFPQNGVPYAPNRYANGHISVTGDPVHFMFGSRVGFSGTADLMALFSVRTYPRWRPPPSWIISNGHISATAYTIYLYSAHSAHRAVIFAIAQAAQLPCFV